MLILFEGTLTSFFKDEKVKKTVEIYVFPTFFACWGKYPDPELDQ